MDNEEVGSSYKNVLHYLLDKKFDLALDEINKCRQLNPDNEKYRLLESIINRTKSIIDENDTNGYNELFLNLVEEDSHNAYFLACLADSYFYIDNIADCKKYYKLALRYEKHDDLIWSNY